MTIKILADSASDLSSKMYEKLNVKVIPIHVYVDDEEFLDGLTITPDELYTQMRASKRATTSQPSPQAFKEDFLQCAQSNEPLIYLALSGTLSGTYESAKIMEREIKEEYPDAPLFVIDTGCVSLGYGLVVIRAAKLANSGASIEEIIDIATYHAKHMEHILTVDNLEYLHRSGRLNRATSVIGNLLKIKPILHIKEGNLELLENVRGSKKVLNRLVALAKERGTDFSNQILGIAHADNLSGSKKLAEILREKLQPKQIIIESVGAAIGVHAGPGLLGLVFSNSKYK